MMGSFTRGYPRYDDGHLVTMSFHGRTDLIPQGPNELVTGVDRWPFVIHRYHG